MFSPSVMYGADPEAFLMRNGVIVGSEKVIPESGLYNKSVVMDGVQIEFNPRSTFNRSDLAHNLQYGFKALSHRLKEVGDVEVCFNSVVDVTKAELDSLSEKSRIFGCAPSLNIYGNQPICVDPTTYLKRAAGGHIHMGLTPPIYNAINGIPDERMRLVPILDIIVGNTCVLIDRDEGQVERRKYYGRAGEFRLPKHGLEYRTPSNFWLKNSVLMDFVFNLVQASASILAESILADGDAGQNHEQLEDQLVALVDIDKFRKAINENDSKLAWENWETIRPLLSKVGAQPFWNEEGLEKFERFAARIQQSGLDYYFKENPLDHWVNLDPKNPGWYEFSKTL